MNLKPVQQVSKFIFMKYTGYGEMQYPPEIESGSLHIMSLKMVLKTDNHELFEWIREINKKNGVKVDDGIRGLHIAIYENSPDSRYPVGLLALWVMENKYYREFYGYGAYKVLDFNDTDNDIFCLMQFVKNPKEFDELIEKLNLGEIMPQNNSLGKIKSIQIN